MYNKDLTHKSATDLQDDLSNNNVTGIYGDSVQGQTFTKDLREALINRFGAKAYETNWFTFWAQGVQYHCFDSERAWQDAYMEQKTW